MIDIEYRLIMYPLSIQDGRQRSKMAATKFSVFDISTSDGGDFLRFFEIGFFLLFRPWLKTNETINIQQIQTHGFIWKSLNFPEIFYFFVLKHINHYQTWVAFILHGGCTDTDSNWCLKLLVCRGWVGIWHYWHLTWRPDNPGWHSHHGGDKSVRWSFR